MEVNPLIVTGDGSVVALDAKMDVEDDALFRHSDLRELRDRSQEDQLEARAADDDIAYVSLDGSVGCLVNGAGLAMATLDVANAAGAAPANFLDVGGGGKRKRRLPPRWASSCRILRSAKCWLTYSVAFSAATWRRVG